MQRNHDDIDEDNQRSTASKYDFVKVRVHLATPSFDGESHVYVLSRYLVARLLTAIQVPSKRAFQAALQLKKSLVDQGTLDISQAGLEEALFKVLSEVGYGDQLYQTRYLQVQRFFQERRPLFVLITGPPRSYKTTIAKQLASRLNITNVIQTDVLEPVLIGCADGDGSCAPRPPETPLFLSPEPLGREAFLDRYRSHCSRIRRALEGDIKKCVQDGKSTIIEGLYLDPGLFTDSVGGRIAGEATHRTPGPSTPPTEEAARAGRGEGGPGPSPSSAPSQGGVFLPVAVSVEDQDEQAYLLASWHAREASRPSASVCPLPVLQERVAWVMDYLRGLGPGGSSPAPSRTADPAHMGASTSNLDRDGVLGGSGAPGPSLDGSRPPPPRGLQHLSLAMTNIDAGAAWLHDLLLDDIVALAAQSISTATARGPENGDAASARGAAAAGSGDASATDQLGLG